MKLKDKGELIRNTYRVKKVFPFVQGVLYYTDLLDREHPVLPSVRFIHALDARALMSRGKIEDLLLRDDDVFFPIRDAFIEEEVLYQVYRRLEGTLLAFHMIKNVPLDLQEALWLLRTIGAQLLRLYSHGHCTMVHPQNILITGAGSLRFLYGGPLGFIPKGGGLSEDPMGDELYDVFTLGALAYTMLTGHSPTANAIRVAPIRSIREDVPEELDQLISKSLSLTLSRRPRMTEFVEELSRIASNLENNSHNTIKSE